MENITMKSNYKQLGITAKEAIESNKTFYAKKWQTNNYYPIDKFVYNAEKNAYEHFVSKTNNGTPYWRSRGFAFENGTGEKNNPTNKEWWQSIFEHNCYILSFEEMKNEREFDLT